MNIFSSTADFSQILNILEIGLLVAFIAIFVLLVIGVIVGLFRGVFSSFFRLLMTISLIVVALVTLNPIANFIGNLDISSVFRYVVITNSSTGASITVGVTNLFSTLADSISAGMYIMNVNADPYSIVNMAITLTTALIKYVVLFVDMILIVTLGNAFITLIWHIGVKRIVPKFAKKMTKVRWLSALSDGIRYVVVFFLMLAPLTAIVNTANNAWQKHKPNTQNEVVNNIGSFLDTYNNSLFAKVLFNWTYDENTGLTFDGQIISSLTSAAYEDGQVSILAFMSAAGDLGGVAMSLFENSDSINVANLFTEETLVNLFDSLNSMNFVPYILPLAFTIAINSAVIEGIDLSDINLNDVDWMNELEILETIIVDIANTGIVDNFFDENGQLKKEVYVNDLVKSMFEDSSYGYTMRAFQKISESDLIQEVLSVVISGLANSNPDIGAFLPCSYQECRAIDWGFELQIIYDNFFRMNKANSEILDYFLDIPASQPQNNILLANETSSTESMDEMLTLIIENIDIFKKALVGSFDRDGNLINCDEEGYTHSNSISNYCLFDLNIFKGALLPLVETLLGSLSTEDSLSKYEEVFEDAFDKLFEGHVVKNFKEEFGAIFDCFKDLSSSDLLLDSIKSNNFDELLKADKKDINELADIVLGFDRSELLTSILKPLLEDTLNTPDIADALKNIGLEPADFNIMDCDNICEEMALIVRALPSIQVVTELIESDDVLNKIGEYAEDVALVLDAVFESDILNPNFDKDNHNNNFYKVLDSVFGMIEDQGIKGLTFKINEVNVELGSQNWSNSKTPNGDYPRDRYGNAIYDGEIGDLIYAFKSLSKKSEVTSSPYYGKTLLEVVSTNDDMGDLVGRLESEFAISHVFACIDRCALLKPTFGDFLDAQLSPFADIGIISEEDGRSFNNVTNWTEEGEKFARTCDILGEMEVDLNNLDILTFNDFDNLNRLLHSLCDSSLFDDPLDPDGTTFNNFLFDKMKTGLSSNETGGYDLLCDETSTDEEKTFYKAAKDFEVRNLDGSDIIAMKEDWCSSEWMDKYVDSTGGYELTHEYYDLDYISQACRLLKALDKMKIETEAITGIKYDNYVQALTSGKAPGDSLKESITYINLFSPMRMVVYHTFDIIVENISGSGVFDVDNANTAYLASYDTTFEDRQFEIDNIFSIYDFYYSDILDQGTIQFEEFIKEPTKLLRVRDMLESFAVSHVFHLAGPGEGYTNTAFQGIMKQVFAMEGIGESLYSDNPLSKDQSSQYKDLYHNKDEKIDYIIEIEHFNYQDNIDDQIEKINDLFEVVSSFVGGPKDVANKEYTDDFTLPGTCYEGLNESGSLSFTNLDVKDISTSALKDVLYNLDNSDLLYECLPNSLVNLFSGGSGSLIDDIMENADPYFAYYLNKTTPNYDSRYGASEIDKLILLIDHFKAMDQFIPNGNVDALLSLQDAEFDLFIVEFEEMLEKLYSTNIFHQYKVSTRDYDDLDFELSSFESLVNKVFNDTGLYKLIYNPEVDSEAFNPSGTKNDDDAAKDKMLAAIKGVSKQEYIYLTTGVKNPVGMSDVWFDYSDETNDEIHAFTKFLKAAKHLDISNLEEIDINIDGEEAKKFSPENVNNLFTSLNSVDCAEGAVGRLVKELMTASNMSYYSSYDGVDYADYFLSQKEYAGEGGIPTINAFLEEIAYYVDGEFDSYNILNQNATDPLYQFVTGETDNKDKKNSSTCLLQFVTDSLLYTHKNIELETIITVGGDPVTVMDDAIILYNAFTPNDPDSPGGGSINNISDFIYGDTKDKKIYTLNHIVHHLDYHPENDGNAIDVLLECGFNNLEFDASDFDSVNNFKTQIEKGLTALTYKDGIPLEENLREQRAYIASELFAGILDKFVVSEIATSNTNYGVGSSYEINPNWLLTRKDALGNPIDHPHDIVASTYDLLNADEAIGIGAILDFYNAGKDSEGNLSIDNFVSYDRDDFRAIFAKLEYQITNEPGELINSRFASLIYISRLHSVFGPTLELAEFLGYVPEPEYDVKVDSSASLFNNEFGFATYGEYVIGAFDKMLTL